MEAIVGSVLATSIFWFMYVIYLNDKVETYKFTIRKMSSPLFPLSASKKALYSLIYYTRLYQKSRKYNEELQQVIREMWRDVRLRPSSVATRDLNTIIEEYRVERNILSRDWTQQDFPVFKIEDLNKEEMKIANELAHEG